MTERVILIKGDSTKWYNQAIFIVNKNTPAASMPVDFVAEAEKIIYGYMAKQKYQANSKKAAVPAVYTQQGFSPAQRRTRKKSKADSVLNFMLILACILVAAVLAYGFMA